MKKKNCYTKVKLAIVLILLSILQVNIASAQPRPHNRPHDEIRVNGEKYRYHDGRFYKPSWFGLFEVIVTVPPVGAVVTILPAGYKVVLVEDMTYYYYRDVYYRACPSGYIVVPAPEVVVIPDTAKTIIVRETESFDKAITVNIPNTDGTFTAVELTKKNDGYLGPQGEFYKKHPTIEELKVLYGK